MREAKTVMNEMKLRLPSHSVNEGMARAAVAAFCAQLDPGACELADIKCAVSEAVTNCIVHAYRDTVGALSFVCTFDDTRDVGHYERLVVIVADDSEVWFQCGERIVSDLRTCC